MHGLLPFFFDQFLMIPASDGFKDGVSSGGVTVVGSDAPSDYHVAPRTENTSSIGGSTTLAPQGGFPPPQTAAMGVAPVKKKRGRPRKYGPDGSATTMALSPMPISSSAPPPVIDFSAGKRGKERPASSVLKTKFQVENLALREYNIEYGLYPTLDTLALHLSKSILKSDLALWVGEWVACSVGNFTPHVITVNSGEDISMKIISFSLQGPRAICILSANGIISSVTLRQPDSSGGTLTYEGRFEILSLSGSFLPNQSGGTRSRAGGMSVSLASPNGRVVGGGVAGLLVAASPVQVVVGSFVAGNQHEQKTKKQKHENIVSIAFPTADPIPNLSSSTSFPGDNWSSLPQDNRNNKPTDINVSLPAGVLRLKVVGSRASPVQSRHGRCDELEPGVHGLYSVLGGSVQCS
ncbi:AT-hook motif nuclear-localized protein 1-like [Senna tora]|uniref:AT-hook motif nuclear-localized protein n=1 Tax=Senna tora TaxID=362788 RepID=A0A834W979_9FABA|nr:AT-hook motif nuclear-localized protein 1-like [Senna tora]